ncbi:site-specific DNA-methyltransferase [Streptomyces sioyaensis]|uniref:DNA-methyltransferase n=1 Tax=Streptomyces sioyaensis TaxID=67364 RepID=UPI003404A08A
MSIYHQDDTATLLLGDAIEQMCTLPDGSVNCIVTSPPYYGLRNYGTAGQYGLEESPAAYVETMRQVFTEARRVLADDGTLWLNLGDSYVCSPKGSESATSGLDGRSNHLTTPAGSGGKNGGGLAAKQLIGIPWRVAFALQDDGWILRNEIIWSKPNAMPEPVRDRQSKTHEHLFMFAKSPRNWYEKDPKCRGDVWSLATRPYPAAHFAVFPIDLPLRCITAGCKPGGTVLDPFSGSGTTGAAARQLGRGYVGIDLNPAYHDLAKDRFAQGVLDFGEAS